MLSFDDDRWRELKGGYRIPFDARPLLKELERREHMEPTWKALWDELHHQGDVGEASFAAVPHLVRIYRDNGAIDWNTYAIVATIELARGIGKNPEVPDWLAVDYYRALELLGQLASQQILDAKDPETVRSMLSVLAIVKGARVHARFMLDYSDDELVDIEQRAQESP